IGLPTITHPGKLSEAFKYFLPGVGSMPLASRTRLACSCTVSLTSASSAEGSHSPTDRTQEDLKGRNPRDCLFQPIYSTTSWPCPMSEPRP
uniref:Uncharacterized protein n=1 Tax=Felis catus TaxID=9685 RepID=A0ABI7XQV4_FELCA